MKTPTLILFLLILTACGRGKKNATVIIDRTDRKIKVVVNATVLENDVFEVYYYEHGQEAFHPLDFISTAVVGGSNPQDIVFELPELVYPERIRLDFGKNKNQKNIELNVLKLASNSKEYVFGTNEIINELKPSKFIDFDKDNFIIETKEVEGRYDPYFYTKNISNIINYLLED